MNTIHFVEGPDESPVALGVGVELAERVGSTGGGADVTRPPNSGSRGEKATGVTRVAALAERGFIGTAPFRRVGSAMRFCDTCACWMAPIGGVRNRGSDAGGFLAADPNLDTISSWSSGTPDAQ